MATDKKPRKRTLIPGKVKGTPEEDAIRADAAAREKDRKEKARASIAKGRETRLRRLAARKAAAEEDARKRAEKSERDRETRARKARERRAAEKAAAVEAAPDHEPDAPQQPTAEPVEPADVLAERRKLEHSLLTAERLRRTMKARENLIDFTCLMMPDPNDPEDITRSTYLPQYFHRALAAVLEEVEKGKLLRVIVTFPFRHGKSELASRKLPAWFIGRDPYRSIMFATYNQPFAEDQGRQVRRTLRLALYQQVFPGVALDPASQSSSRMETVQGGFLAFVGRGGSITGRGADLLIIDDPLKDREEAESQTIRDQLWDWFNDVASTRLMSDTGAIIIIQTRWHEDDLVGRLTDPTNPHYNEEEARQWKVVNIRGIAEEDDVLKREPGTALWPEKFSAEYLLSFKRRSPRAYTSLIQQRPTPEDGDFFKKDMIRTFNRRDMIPRDLRIYAASDHAVGEKQTNDKTCLMTIGVDQNNEIWILDVIWRRMATDKAVEEMLNLMKRRHPLIWWAESDHIKKSIGPFLYKRMREEQTYIHMSELPSGGQDKVKKAQPLQGRMSMGMVHFPSYEPWFEDAKLELLKFPNGRHDDFVDTLANFARGLERQIGPGAPVVRKPPPKAGTLAWVKRDDAFRREREKMQETLGGW